MALEKIVSVDLIEVLENGSVQVRTKAIIKENNVEITSQFQHHVVAPGVDYSAEDDKVKSICAAIHTPAVIEAYKLAQIPQIPA